MWIVGGIVLGLIGWYLLRNGRRNGDPLNRKCAAEICEYLTHSEQVNASGIAEIFMRNARYRTQARHVVSMVPAILIKAGYPSEQSMSFVPIMFQAAALIPE
ncbi:hypothetical protein ACFX5Q_25765 [Mesorhizobium sp. IMUNJ 23033]|uniref:hypothetical protein n=1 Tax=Mesorhizobium sp. IMUNJ 23033 TaxID=3378039 RepID=UPI00384EEACF